MRFCIDVLNLTNLANQKAEHLMMVNVDNGHIIKQFTLKSYVLRLGPTA